MIYKGRSPGLQFVWGGPKMLFLFNQYSVTQQTLFYIKVIEYKEMHEKGNIHVCENCEVTVHFLGTALKASMHQFISTDVCSSRTGPQIWLQPRGQDPSKFGPENTP